MMDTAHPPAGAETDPNVQLDEAANAFLLLDNPAAARPRDEQGRFASENEPDDEEDAEDEAPLEGEAEPEADEADEEAAETAQPMPPSWPADQAEQWSRLPPEMQAYMAKREGERESAVQAKFQESANARKEATLAAQEAQTKRDELIRQIETVEAIYRQPEPDPRAFGYGTRQYNEAGYLAAHRQWRDTNDALAQLTEQREGLQKENSDAQRAEFGKWLEAHNAEFAPQFVELAPEIKDPAKAAAVFNEVFEYAKQNGVDPSLFEPENVKDIPLGHVLTYWKAAQWDKIRATPAKAKPAPKTGPAVKPGVSSPTSARKEARTQQAFDRLDREGSIEAGAAVFRNLGF